MNMDRPILEENAQGPEVGPGPDQEAQASTQTSVSPGLDFMTFLKAPTGDGSIEEYLNHPLNFNGSEGLAQVIRGLTGMFERLDYAIIDVLMGMFRMRPRPGGGENERPD